MQFIRPEETGYRFQLSSEKAMINVGSVGQPRDGDWRSCYVIIDEPWIEFRRVEYDLRTTMDKIYAIDDLDNFLADRLQDGR